jgi:hypothetical protein
MVDTVAGYATAIKFIQKTGLEPVWREEQTKGVFLHFIGNTK